MKNLEKGLHCIALAILLAFVADAHGQPASTTAVLISGFGQDSCGTWVESRRVRNRDWSYEVAWAQGFIAAHNYYSKDGPAKMMRAEPLGIATWLDGFCAANPSRDVLAGMLAYIEANGGPKSGFEWKRP